GIPEKQHGLEEHQAGAPDCGRSPQPRQHHLGHHRLNEKHQTRAQKESAAKYRQHCCGPQTRHNKRWGEDASIHFLCLVHFVVRREHRAPQQSHRRAPAVALFSSVVALTLQDKTSKTDYWTEMRSERQINGYRQRARIGYWY